MTRRESITDDEIAALIERPKFIKEDSYKKIKFRKGKGYLRFDLDVFLAEDNAEKAESFSIFCRASIDNPMDFSVGLRVDFQDGNPIRLMRCNGLHGSHTNHIERAMLEGKHIHIATERYIKRGHNEDGYAVEARNEYNNLDSALEYLLSRCHITIEGMDLLKLLRG